MWDVPLVGGRNPQLFQNRPGSLLGTWSLVRPLLLCPVLVPCGSLSHVRVSLQPLPTRHRAGRKGHPSRAEGACLSASRAGGQVTSARSTRVPSRRPRVTGPVSCPPARTRPSLRVRRPKHRSDPTFTHVTEGPPSPPARVAGNAATAVPSIPVPGQRSAPFQGTWTCLYGTVDLPSSSCPSA